MANVVVIDSGVELEHPIFKHKHIRAYELVNGNIIKSETDEFGHGTAVTGIICKHSDNV